MAYEAQHDPDFYVKRLVDRIPSMLAYWDLDLRCRFANRAYETLFRVGQDQLVGASMRDLLGPELFALTEPYIEAVLRGDEQTFERPMPGPDGANRHCLAVYVPDIVDGEVTGFATIVTEVTQLKRVEARLEATIRSLEAEHRARRSVEGTLVDVQQNLALTLASIDAGFVATDRLGCIIGMNEVSERITGWTEDEARGRPLRDVLVRDDQPTSAAAVNPVDQLIAQGLTADTARHVFAVARDGRRTPVEIRAALTHGDDGAVRGLAIVVRDMTRVLEAGLESNRLAAIVESSHDVIIGKTLDGRITSWNAAATALFGYSAAEAIGMPVQKLIPDDRQDEEMRILANLARGVRVPEFETFRRTRDGRLVEVSITISPIRDGHGRIAGASKIVRDLTQRRLAEQARRNAERLEAENRNIQEANRLKSQFLATMSHELRTPLNAIIGFADLLHSGRVRVDSPRHHTYLGHIASSGRHLLQIINDVLDLAKVESGKFEFFPEAIDLESMVREVGDILHASIERKRIRFDTDIDPQIGEVVLDKARLKQVLYNYLSNALKFTPDGGSVIVRARPADAGHFLIEVQDSGNGIAPDQIPRLFQEFQQIDAGAGNAPTGTGLGLALTRRLIEAQGGVVGVNSEPGRGSVFYAMLNRIHGSDPVQGGHDTESASRADRRSVLVIEDDSRMQARLIRVLSESGFQVEAAGTAALARHRTATKAFDALTLDLRLPDENGLGLLASIRVDGPSRHTPVVGITSPMEAGVAASFPIADILRKPVRSEEIVAALVRLRKPTDENLTVLVIDDDPLALELMRATLAGIGVHSVCVHDGRLALRDLDLHRPHAIILDLMMPQFDGFAVLDALHRLPKWRDVPVFIWTAMILTDDEYASLARSARVILSKGGGDVAAMLEHLTLWQPAARTAHSEP